MEQQTGSKSGKKHVKAVYCHPASLTYMQSTSCEMQAGWSTRWNQDCWEKYQQPQMCWWHGLGHQVVNIIHLLEKGRFVHLRNDSGNVHQILLSGYFSSGSQPCPTLCDPMDCSTPGFPVHHQVSELAQTHVHWVGDTIQPSYPMSSPSPPAFYLF